MNSCDMIDIMVVRLSGPFPGLPAWNTWSSGGTQCGRHRISLLVSPQPAQPTYQAQASTFLEPVELRKLAWDCHCRQQSHQHNHSQCTQRSHPLHSPCPCRPPSQLWYLLYPLHHPSSNLPSHHPHRQMCPLDKKQFHTFHQRFHQ